jgi:hypothetical protein
MDCEGCEFGLLDPHNDPILLRTDILVEIHSEHGDKRQIMTEFRNTHNVTEIRTVLRTILDAPQMVRGLDVLSAMDEGRSEDQTWLFLQLKRRSVETTAGCNRVSRNDVKASTPRRLQ